MEGKFTGNEKVTGAREGAATLIPPVNLRVFFFSPDPSAFALPWHSFFLDIICQFLWRPSFSPCVGLWLVLTLCLVLMIAWLVGFFLDYNRRAGNWSRMMPDDPLRWEDYAIEK